MGVPTPPDMPEIQNGKWYCCKIRVWESMWPNGEYCTEMTFYYIDFRVFSGETINQNSLSCIILAPQISCNIVELRGPFDTQAEAETFCSQQGT